MRAGPYIAPLLFTRARCWHKYITAARRVYISRELCRTYANAGCLVNTNICSQCLERKYRHVDSPVFRFFNADYQKKLWRPCTRTGGEVGRRKEEEVGTCSAWIGKDWKDPTLADTLRKRNIIMIRREARLQESDSVLSILLYFVFLPCVRFLILLPSPFYPIFFLSLFPSPKKHVSTLTKFPHISPFPSFHSYSFPIRVIPSLHL